MENINQEQKADLVAIAEELSETNDHLGTLSEQINDYESTIETFQVKSKVLQNKINHIETESENKISRLKIDNIEQRKTLMVILNEAEESNEFSITLNSRLMGFQEKINELEYENAQYKSTINELGDENINKNTSRITMKNDIYDLNGIISKLNSKIENYEGTI